MTRYNKKWLKIQIKDLKFISKNLNEIRKMVGFIDAGTTKVSLSTEIDAINQIVDILSYIHKEEKTNKRSTKND